MARHTSAPRRRPRHHKALEHREPNPTTRTPNRPACSGSAPARRASPPSAVRGSATLVTHRTPPLGSCRRPTTSRPHHSGLHHPPPHPLTHQLPRSNNPFSLVPRLSPTQGFPQPAHSRPTRSLRDGRGNPAVSSAPSWLSPQRRRQLGSRDGQEEVLTHVRERTQASGNDAGLPPEPMGVAQPVRPNPKPARRVHARGGFRFVHVPTGAEHRG